MQYQLKITVRSRYPGLFGFERGMGAHHSALMAAMRHYESIGDDASLGLVLVALVRGRKPWMMDLRYKYFKLNRLVRFSEVLLVLLRWVMRNLSMPLDDIRRLLKKLEHHLPHRDKRVAVTEYLYRALEEAGRAADAYDTARLLGRHDMMGFMRKKQMDLAIGRGASDMYRPIDPAVWGRTPRGSRSLLTDAEALKDDPADTRCRIHLVELLLANGDHRGALDVSRAGGDVADFDVQGQRLVLLLEQIHRGSDASTSVRASRKKPKRTATSGNAGTPPAEVIDEVLECCQIMLSLDPGSTETIKLLSNLRDRGMAEGERAERLAAVLGLAS